MIRLLDLEERSQERSDHAPLVQAHTVQHDQKTRGGTEEWEEVRLDNVHREGRRVHFTPQPAWVFLSYPPTKVRAEVGHERLHRIEEAPFPGFFEVDMPARQFDVELGEVLIGASLFALLGEPTEASREVLRRTLLADHRTLQNAGDD